MASFSDLPYSEPVPPIWLSWNGQLEGLQS